MTDFLTDDVRKAAELHRRAVFKAAPTLPDESIDLFLKAFRAASRETAYHFVPPRCESILNGICRTFGPSTVPIFLKCSLATAIMKVPYQLAETTLPKSILDLYPRHILRIVKEFDERHTDFYAIGNDRFIKDLCILTQRIYPGGGRLIEPDCGIPRRLIWQSNLIESCRALSNLIYYCRGYRPFLQLHTHTSDLTDFTPDGMLQTYIRLADLLRYDKRWLGVYTASWFNDPVISDVSPRLTYLRTTPMSGGAFLLKGTVDENSTAAALSRSPTRRRLHQEGQYQPRIYYLIWPRTALLHWSESNEL